MFAGGNEKNINTFGLKKKKNLSRAMTQHILYLPKELGHCNSLLTLILLNKLRCHTPSNFQPIRLLDPDCCYKFKYLIANSADPDQLASSEAN